MAKKSETVAPIIDELRLNGLRPGDAQGIDAHGAYDGLEFSGADLDGRDLSGSTFTECAFVDSSAHEAGLRGTGFIEVRFERLNAPIFSAPRSRFRDVIVTGSRLGSAEFYESGWQSVRFINCKLGYVNLRGASLQDVTFSDCSIDELDLGGAKLNRVTFSATQTASLDLTGARNSNVDLRDLEIRSITGVEGLKGATINPYQLTELAPFFATQLGVTVED